jgi:acetyl-CoA acetyltransferase
VGRPRAGADRAYGMAGVGSDDVDVAMIYDAFSPHIFHGLESMGFCQPGEAKDLIRDGMVARGGRMPVNPNGGLIGEAYIHGMNLITEAVRQVRGTAANQVEGAEVVLMTSSGGTGILAPDA